MRADRLDWTERLADEVSYVCVAVAHVHVDATKRDLLCFAFYTRKGRSTDSGVGAICTDQKGACDGAAVYKACRYGIVAGKVYRLQRFAVLSMSTKVFVGRVSEAHLNIDAFGTKRSHLPSRDPKHLDEGNILQC